MREYRGADGSRRLWYEDDEIERIVEVELHKAKLLPTVTNCVVDLDRFVEGYLQASLDQYAHLPDGVLGTTEFAHGRAPKISINRDLTGALDDDDPSPGMVGRLRATLAHEAAHVLLHRPFYEIPAANLSLFPDEGGEAEPRSVLHRCPKTSVGHRRRVSDWREVQANRGMAALLMPRRVFRQAAQAAIAHAVGHETISVAEISLVVTQLAAAFAVSKQAAEIRLHTLGLVKSPDQQTI